MNSVPKPTTQPTPTQLDDTIWAAVEPLGWTRYPMPYYVDGKLGNIQYDPPGDGDGCIYLLSDVWFKIGFPAREAALHAEGIAAAIAAVAGKCAQVWPLPQEVSNA